MPGIVEAMVALHREVGPARTTISAIAERAGARSGTVSSRGGQQGRPQGCPRGRRARLAAAVAHALRFETWRSLARAEALGDVEAADLMVTFAQGAAASGAGSADSSRRRPGRA